MTQEPQPCKPCQIASQVPAYPFFSLGCLYCGARIIQHLATLPIARSAVAARRRENLTHWVAFGHSEADLRSLAQQKTPVISPAAGLVVSAGSGNHPAMKRR